MRVEGGTMKFKHSERGQSIVLIVISMIGLIAMAALIVDGGHNYLRRRNAQTAADAAALAGAYEWCVLKSGTEDIDDVVEQYSVTENGASTYFWEIDDADKTINVDVTITGETFFAKVFGQPTATVAAHAAAGCFPPGVAKGVLPLAWACHNPDEAEEVWSDSGDCVYKAITFEELELLRDGPNGDGTIGEVMVSGLPYTAPFDFLTGYLPEIYLIMNSEDLEPGLDGICESSGGYMDCDINNDGKDDFQGSGDISWLDLDGMGGSLESSWITDGFPGTLSPHYWIPSQTGVNTNIFINAITEVMEREEIVMVPVFNTFCNGHPFETAGCIDAAHVDVPPPSPPLEEYEVPTTASSPIYYHIAGFAAFIVTCVDQASANDCPAHDAAVAEGTIAANTKSIEGYFVTGLPLNVAGGTGGIDLGVYVISLTE